MEVQIFENLKIVDTACNECFDLVSQDYVTMDLYLILKHLRSQASFDSDVNFK